VEKHIKAFLQEDEQPTPKTHSLIDLLALALQSGKRNVS
jgi:HEPN domain-containing protein